MSADLGHPRPQLRRASCILLDGEWDFADDPAGHWRHPDQVAWTERITVPFAPEAAASGIGRTGFRLACWYRRTLHLSALPTGDRLLLHFGAVDYAASVWVDGHQVGSHEGGYTGFAVDLTPYAGTGARELVVRAEDDPADLAKPRGKQDWELEPHSIWYPRTTGIWQSVWLEQVPEIALSRLHWSADLDRYALCMQAAVDGPLHPGVRLRVRLSYGSRALVDDLVGILGPRVQREFVLDGRGVDTLRDELTWSPDHPALIDAVVELIDVDGTVLDRVESYAGMRSVQVRAGQFLLNGFPMTLRLVLDQGYWPHTGLTPPDEAALRRDVELAKAMGFNGVRKHQKIEDPRYLYWADRLGLMVWEEMPPAYRFDELAVRRVTTQWTEAVERDRSHPCIVAWVPFNESTGVLSLPGRLEERHYVEGLALLTRALDPGRLVVSNDGWEALGGDLVGIHDYDPRPEELLRRYAPEALAETLSGFGNNGRLQLLDDLDRKQAGPGRGPRAFVLSEFGGLGYTDSGPTVPLEQMVVEGVRNADDPEDRLHQPAAWGYATVPDPGELVGRYAALIEAALSLERFSGFCYTQFCDTYQEVNGLLREDRTPKAPLPEIARATLGPFRSRHGVINQLPIARQAGQMLPPLLDGGHRDSGLAAPAAAPTFRAPQEARDRF